MHWEENIQCICISKVCFSFVMWLFVTYHLPGIPSQRFLLNYNGTRLYRRNGFYLAEKIKLNTEGTGCIRVPYIRTQNNKNPNILDQTENPFSHKECPEDCLKVQHLQNNEQLDSAVVRNVSDYDEAREGFEGEKLQWLLCSAINHCRALQDFPVQFVAHLRWLPWSLSLSLSHTLAQTWGGGHSESSVPSALNFPSAIRRLS